MYGLLIEAVVEVIRAKFGITVWEQVKKKARLDNQVVSTHKQYSEALIQKIVRALSDITGTPVDELMDMFGVEFVNFVAKYGYEKFLRVLGRHMRDFLNGLDNLHEYMKFSYPKLKPPSFFVDQENATGLVLHYRSKRKGFVHYVMGQIRQVGKLFYNLEVKIEIESQRMEMDMNHVTFNLTFENHQYLAAKSSCALSESMRSESAKLIPPVKSDTILELFPFHLIFKKNMQIISVGESLRLAIRHCRGENMQDIFNLVRPYIEFSWDEILQHTNNVFEVSTIEPVKRPDTPDAFEEAMRAGSIATQTTGSFDARSLAVDQCLRLKGQMLYVQEFDAMLYLAAPVLENLDVMFYSGLYLNDLSMHDSSRDFVLVGTQQAAELKLALDQEKTKSKALEELMRSLDSESKRADELLYRMIPRNIADRLRSGEAVINLCESFSSCTILLSDVVGFTSTCSKLTPMEVVSLLNEIYTKFDKSLELHNVYKVETIGDAYMVVSGVPERIETHATEIIEMGLDMLDEISMLKNPATGKTMMIRIGCHTGPVVSGVVGLKMPRYCLFGDAVNTATKMEATSKPMRMHISETTKNALPSNTYETSERGVLDYQGKGELKTYLLEGRIGKNGKSVKFRYEIDPAELLETKVKPGNSKWEGFKLLYDK